MLFGRAMRRSLKGNGREAKMTVERRLQGRKRADVVISAGLQAVVIEASITNFEPIRQLKRQQVGEYKVLLERELGCPDPTAQDISKDIWEKVGSGAILARLEWNGEGGLNVAICQGRNKVVTTNFPSPGNKQPKRVEQRTANSILDVAVKDLLEEQRSVQDPVSLVVFAPSTIQVEIERWCRTKRVNLGIFAPLKREARWPTETVTGAAAEAAASRLMIGWRAGDNAGILPPNAIQVRTAMAVYDTRGTAWPETVQSFQRITGKTLPKSIGESVIRSTATMYRKWRGMAKANAGKV